MRLAPRPRVSKQQESVFLIVSYKVFIHIFLSPLREGVLNGGKLPKTYVHQPKVLKSGPS